MSMEPKDTKDSPSNLDRFTFHITAFAMTPKQAWSIADAVRSSLDGWKEDPPLEESRIIDMASDVFESTEIFSFTLEFEMFFS